MGLIQAVIHVRSYNYDPLVLHLNSGLSQHSNASLLVTTLHLLPSPIFDLYLY